MENKYVNRSDNILIPGIKLLTISTWIAFKLEWAVGPMCYCRVEDHKLLPEICGCYSISPITELMDSLGVLNTVLRRFSLS